METIFVLNTSKSLQTTLPADNGNNNIPLFCSIVKHFCLIPQILIVWQRPTSHTGAFATGGHNLLKAS
jgi:hypothetical protein